MGQMTCMCFPLLLQIQRLDNMQKKLIDGGGLKTRLMRKLERAMSTSANPVKGWRGTWLLSGWGPDK